MCGIVGVMSDRVKHPAEFYEFMSNLLYEAEVRGRDATGFAAIADGEFVTDKLDVDAEDFVRLSADWRRLHGSRKISMIGHTRAATNGTPKDNKNNHPFHGSRYSMVHNGGIWNHYEAARQLGFSLKTGCDSELILHLLESEKDETDGIQRTFGELDYRGWFAVSFLNRETGDINLFREKHTPCVVMRIPRWNAIAFASTYDIINRAIAPVLGGHIFSRKFMKPVFNETSMDDEAHVRLCAKTNNAYVVDLSGTIDYRIPEKKIVASDADTSAFSGGTSTWASNAYHDEDKCIECFRDILECRGAAHSVGANFMCNACYSLDDRVISTRAGLLKQLESEEDSAIIGIITNILPQQLVSACGNDIQAVFNRILNHRDLVEDTELSDNEVQRYLAERDQSLEYKVNAWSDMTLARMFKLCNGEYLAYVETISESLALASSSV